MITTNKTGIARLIENCVAHGMTHVVCSPGSRNAALVIAIDNHPNLEAIVIHDERCAAFYALGMAQQSNTPVGLVCTSGSAMLNYFPAVAEAYYQCVPIVVMSADRPTEWVNHGDGQTIMQAEAYGKHVRYYGEIEEYVADEEFGEFDRHIEEAFEVGNGNWKGPIHFNCPISEPMYDTVEVDRPELLLKDGEAKELLGTDILDSLEPKWNASKKRMILCGQMEKDSRLLNQLAILAEDSSVVVLVENTSNLVHPKFNHCIDRSLSSISEKELKEYQPDVLITLGGAIISKRIKKFLRESNIQHHWRVSCAFPEMDTYRKLSSVIWIDQDKVIERINSWNKPHASNFGSNWKKLDFINKDKIEGFIEQTPYSDLTVFEMILDYIPDHSLLHMGNSSVVRYCQLFDPVAAINYYSNRGTSGIDGSTSTACGAALIKKNKLNVLISGDVSFFYDSNALWSNYLGANLRIIVINNSGGGIFRIIEGPSQSKQLEKYFETDQSFSAEKLCEAFNVEYRKASSLEEVEGTMPEFFGEPTSDRPMLLEVFTPNNVNDGVLKEFFKHFSQV